MTKQAFEEKIAKWGFVSLSSQEKHSHEYGAISAFQGCLDPLLISILLDEGNNPFVLIAAYCTFSGHKITHVYGDTYEKILMKFFEYLCTLYPEAQYD